MFIAAAFEKQVYLETTVSARHSPTLCVHPSHLVYISTIAQSSQHVPLLDEGESSVRKLSGILATKELLSLLHAA